MEIEYTAGGVLFAIMVTLMVVSAIGIIAGLALIGFAILNHSIPLLVGGFVDLAILGGTFTLCWMWFTEPV